MIYNKGMKKAGLYPTVPGIPHCLTEGFFIKFVYLYQPASYARRSAGENK
jgi:hypothetical protein